MIVASTGRIFVAEERRLRAADLRIGEWSDVPGLVGDWIVLRLKETSVSPIVLIILRRTSLTLDRFRNGRRRRFDTETKCPQKIESNQEVDKVLQLSLTWLWQTVRQAALPPPFLSCNRTYPAHIESIKELNQKIHLIH